MTSTDTRIRPPTDFTRLTAKELLPTPQDRMSRGSLAAPQFAVGEEALIVDDRSGLSPSQAVENRLSSLLSGSALPISSLQMRGRVRSR